MTVQFPLSLFCAQTKFTHSHRAISQKVISAGTDLCSNKGNDRSLLCNRDHIVVCIAVNELIVGIDAGKRGRLIDNNLEGSVFLGEFFLLEIERFLFIFLSTEDPNLNVIGQGHGSFHSIAVGLQFARLHLERDLVLTVGGPLGSGGEGSVVVENDAIEAIVHQVLKFGRGLRTDRIHQQAGVGVRSVEGGQGASTIAVSYTHLDVYKRQSQESDRVGAPGWGDAGVIVPWTTWVQYGDKAMIEQNWEAMQRWMQFIHSRNPDYLRKNGVGPNFGDWLAPDENTNKDLLATAYWALIANMMSQMARATGKDADAQRYDDLVQNIRASFQKAYIKDDGEVGTGTQTSYVVALYTRMAPEALEPLLVDKLVKDIEARNWHLSTGFLGTPFLLFTLADHGRSDLAYRLLLNDTYPSWGYMLSKGATTWWERWNGDTGDPSMNSYNHYAFGSVIAWVYRYAAGIDTTPDSPGFKEIVVHPHLDARMTAARAEYESIYGKIVSDWKGTGAGPFSLKVTIPANTSARIVLPAITGAHLAEDGNPIEAQAENGSYVVKIGSGSYSFEVK